MQTVIGYCPRGGDRGLMGNQGGICGRGHEQSPNAISAAEVLDYSCVYLSICIGFDAEGVDDSLQYSRYRRGRWE